MAVALLDSPRFIDVAGVQVMGGPLEPDSLSLTRQGPGVQGHPLFVG